MTEFDNFPNLETDNSWADNYNPDLDELWPPGSVWPAQEGQVTATGYNRKPQADLRPIIKITSLKLDGVEQENDYRVLIPKDSRTVLTIEIRHPLDDSLINIDSEFVMPLDRGSIEDDRNIKLNFIQGKALVDLVWSNVGTWTANEAVINRYLPPDRQYRFSELKLSVFE